MRKLLIMQEWADIQTQNKYKKQYLFSFSVEIKSAFLVMFSFPPGNQNDVLVKFFLNDYLSKLSTKYVIILL